MNAIAPKVIELLDHDNVPIEFETSIDKPCTCGNGIERWFYVQIKTAAHYWYAQHHRSTQREEDLKLELELAKAEIRLLKQKRFGKESHLCFSQSCQPFWKKIKKKSIGMRTKQGGKFSKR